MSRTTQRKAYGLEQTPAQREWQREHARQRRAFTRWKCDGMKFWRECSDKRCRRHQRCSGDVFACWDTKWRAQPQIIKDHLKRTIWLMQKGMPPAEASRTARLELMRELEVQIEAAEREEAAAAGAANATEAPVATSVDVMADAQPFGSIEPPTPRVRTV